MSLKRFDRRKDVSELQMFELYMILIPSGDVRVFLPKRKIGGSRVWLGWSTALPKIVLAPPHTNPCTHWLLQTFAHG